MCACVNVCVRAREGDDDRVVQGLVPVQVRAHGMAGGARLRYVPALTLSSTTWPPMRRRLPTGPGLAAGVADISLGGPLPLGSAARLCQSQVGGDHRVSIRGARRLCRGQRLCVPPVLLPGLAGPAPLRPAPRRAARRQDSRPHPCCQDAPEHCQHGALWWQGTVWHACVRVCVCVCVCVC